MKSTIDLKTPVNKKVVFDADREVVPMKSIKQQKAVNKKIVFEDVGEDVPEKSIKQKKAVNKKVVFDENGEIVPEEAIKQKKHKESDKPLGNIQNKRRDIYTTGNRKYGDADEDRKKWFELYTEYNTNDILDLKERQLTELRTLCEKSFAAELIHFKNKNPSDAKWLETALHTGTAKDKANAGALLVTSNPLANLQTLETLISFCKLSNKASTDVITVLTDLFLEALLPKHRKLISIPLRAGDWKALQIREDLSKETKQKIYAYWQFESELKDQYFEFLKNLQQSIQNGQDVNKNCCIITTAKLLVYAPEKEQMLLSMLINKLGDPSNKVASKALYHLSEVAFKHPNMCGVITTEAEKLLFRNNISERAQHFALCFLAQIAPNGNSDVCTKLVNICFSFFKVLVKKGAVNNKTMQAILRCLQKAIVDAKPLPGSTEIMTKDMQDTVYRLVHLADIGVSIQTLGMLLQLITIKSEKSDRFYNALYRKLSDLNLANVGTKTAANLLHIVHRAIHIDQNVSRGQAFIKRLLQISLYLPAQVVCGCLIVVNKLLKLRPELGHAEVTKLSNNVTDDDLAKFDSDGEEKYEDVRMEGDEDEIQEEKIKEEVQILKPKQGQSSWHHAKNVDEDAETRKVSEIAAVKYDPYHRVPAFAGAEFAMNVELDLLKEHFHPTVQVFAESIINRKRIDYYGDPLKDFSLTHFLERFVFKNPKKMDEKKDYEERTANQILHKKVYLPYGARGKPVSALKKRSCTEDELFIFNYLEKKRETQVKRRAGEDTHNVDDDEFEEYLDSLCKKSKKVKQDKDEDEEDLDYLKDLGAELKMEKKKKQKAKIGDENEEENEIDADWGGDDGDGSDLPSDDDNFDDELDSDDMGSVSLDEDNDGSEDSELDENLSDDSDGPKAKRSKKSAGKEFQKALKNKDDISSLFAAADDFAELLEETSKTKGHGTLNAVFNKDKSSEKQLKWEENRRSSLGKQLSGQKKFGKFSGKKNKRK